MRLASTSETSVFDGVHDPSAAASEGPEHAAAQLIIVGRIQNNFRMWTLRGVNAPQRANGLIFIVVVVRALRQSVLLSDHVLVRHRMQFTRGRRPRFTCTFVIALLA